MTLHALKARGQWLFSFGDLLTLLITFFILMIVLNKGEITRLQKWSDERLAQAYHQLQSELTQPWIEVARTRKGIRLALEPGEAFVRGGYEPSDALQTQLRQLGQVLAKLDLFQPQRMTLPESALNAARENGLSWQASIRVAGHTDDLPVNPASPMRNNWFLSAMRAQTVMRWLSEQSALPPEYFVVSGFGSHRPQVANDSPEARARNRRVEIYLSAAFEKRPGSPVFPHF
ncbi:OmpA family protein [Thiomicrospira sp. WB1]|uniref:OmpA/MotB family protein n=1 Tax=Thiomicrospira sp. WB1 TaxID=1685380 RepID=UPI0007468139|nr:OmpA family protein [Thiomicrospira sp. WB1]KUJ72596.1 hypothetical protein AVO41_01980 [Thiomicrospira sp. WB1]